MILGCLKHGVSCHQTCIDGSLNAALHSSAFNADLRHATQHSLHLFGYLLWCILFLHMNQEVCSDLFSLGKPIRGQIYKYRLKIFFFCDNKYMHNYCLCILNINITTYYYL